VGRCLEQREIDGRDGGLSPGAMSVCCRIRFQAGGDFKGGGGPYRP